MKLSPLMTATMLTACAAFSSYTLATPEVEQEVQLIEQSPEDQASSLQAIKDFEAEQALGNEELSARAYQRCKATVYTRYTSLKINGTRALAGFYYDGGNCRRYSFSIIRNYEGHNLTVTLIDSNGNYVSGGYGSSASKTLYKPGTYYWQVENETKNSPYKWGGFTYEVRSKG